MTEENIEFPIVAVETDSEMDNGFTVQLDHPFRSYLDGTTTDVLPNDSAVTQAVEEMYDSGLDATQFDEEEAVGVLVTDANGNFVDARVK